MAGQSVPTEEILMVLGMSRNIDREEPEEKEKNVYIEQLVP